MFRMVKEWIYKKRRKSFYNWRENTAKLIVDEVIPEGIPFQYDTVLSFLQVEGFDPRFPIRLDLLFPDYPLAIDFIGPHHDNSFAVASRYIGRDNWEILQQHVAIKKQMFASYGCHYMTISSDEAVDTQSIIEKIRVVIGHYLE